VMPSATCVSIRKFFATQSRRCFRRIDLLWFTCSSLGWRNCSLWYLDWPWRIDSSWSTDAAASVLRLYIGPLGTVISLLRTARWISPLQVQSPWFLFVPLVLHEQLQTGVLSIAAVPMALMMRLARLSLLLR